METDSSFAHLWVKKTLAIALFLCFKEQLFLEN